MSVGRLRQKGGGLQSKIRVEQGSKVVATKEELEGTFLGGERYLASNDKAVSCWGEVGGTCVQMVEKL